MKFSFYALFFCITFNVACAGSAFKTDSLSNILGVKEKNSREKLLAEYIRHDFAASPIGEIYAAKTDIDKFLAKYNEKNKPAFEYFAESMYQRRLSHVSDSEHAMINAIQSADKNGDSFLSYTFLNYLAGMQTEEGNVIGAVTSYRMANKDAIKLNDNNLQMIIDLNISDVYYKNYFYSQSLFYLDQAQATGARFWPDDQRVKNIIYYNKSENFFRMSKPDSLRVYNERLRQSKANTYKLYTYKNRTDYYLYLLHHEYKKAINLIHAMQNDEGYKFDDQDLQNLSDAYYKNGQPDLAKVIINGLLSKPSETNHPEIKFHLYDVLGEIAEEQNDYLAASGYFKLALQQSEDNMTRLTQVDNISSMIKSDDITGYYSQIDETYEKERLWLIFGIILALLIILVIAMFYRTVRQKRHYEKLLFVAKKEELSFINSHDVRKHLTNILGLIGVVRLSEDRENEYLQVEDHLFHSAQELDKSIKSISEKLDG
ncbi:MAG TPA: hypothetical protein VIM16_14395 [Mucilaginibacter sp.]|jgi:hypothetical protein